MINWPAQPLLIRELKGKTKIDYLHIGHQKKNV
jgi:hypothetical protein